MEKENHAIKIYSNKLIERAEKLYKFSLTNWSTMTDINSLPSSGNCVYMISAPSSTQITNIINGVNKCRNNCDKCKCENPIKHFPKINEHNCKDNCVYVGSTKDLKSRIKQHFDDRCWGRTYALYLKCYYKEVDLVVKYIKIDDRELMQDVEDAFWDFYKPILGRRGQK